MELFKAFTISIVVPSMAFSLELINWFKINVCEAWGRTKRLNWRRTKVRYCENEKWMFPSTNISSNHNNLSLFFFLAISAVNSSLSSSFHDDIIDTQRKWSFHKCSRHQSCSRNRLPSSQSVHLMSHHQSSTSSSPARSNVTSHRRCRSRTPQQQLPPLPPLARPSKESRKDVR